MYDFLLIAMLTAAVLATRSMVASRVRWALRLVAIGGCAAQLAIQGPRVELVPAYVVAVVLVVLVSIEAVRHGYALRGASDNEAAPRGARFMRWIGVGAATPMLLLSLALCVLLDSLDYPTPSGPYAIGTREIHLTDSSRAEFFTEAGDDRREILVRVSYPADDGGLEQLADDMIPSIAALAVGWFWPNPTTASWGAMRTHAKRDAPIAMAQQRYPVLIFSHAMGGYPEQNTALVEQLASHGYVVMAVNHAFLSSGMRFANGSMIGLEILRHPNPFPNGAQQRRDEQALQAELADPRRTTAERADLVHRLAAVNPSSTKRWAEIHALMSGDQRFLLDSLRSLPPQLADRLDLDRVGVFGMSSGGTATHITCAVDSRCRAGLNMDGFQPLLLDLPPLRASFMHMSRATVFTNAIAHERSQAASYVVRVEGAEHLSFTDDVLTLHRLKALGRFGSGLLGTVDSQRMVQLVNDYALAFFDEGLLGRPDSILEGLAQRYPEASTESKWVE